MSESTGLPTFVVDELDERHSGESQDAFEARVRKSFDIIRARFANSPTDVIYVCSHHDFLTVAAYVWPTDFSHQEREQSWSTLEFQVFELTFEGLLKTTTRARIPTRREQDSI